MRSSKGPANNGQLSAHARFGWHGPVAEAADWSYFGSFCNLDLALTQSPKIRSAKSSRFEGIGRSCNCRYTMRTTATLEGPGVLTQPQLPSADRDERPRWPSTQPRWQEGEVQQQEQRQRLRQH